MNTIAEILTIARERLASDIHLSEGAPVVIRIYGELTYVNQEYSLTRADMDTIFSVLLGENTQKREEFQKTRDTDFAYIDSI